MLDEQAPELCYQSNPKLPELLGNCLVSEIVHIQAFLWVTQTEAPEKLNETTVYYNPQLRYGGSSGQRGDSSEHVAINACPELHRQTFFLRTL